MKKIRWRQLKFLGHIVRAQELQSDCILGRVEGTRAKGRQKTKYMDSILSYWPNHGRVAQDGERQRRLEIHGRQRHKTVTPVKVKVKTYLSHIVETHTKIRVEYLNSTLFNPLFFKSELKLVLI